MELLKKSNEDEVGASEVAASAMPLFASFVRRTQPTGQSIPKPIVIKYGKSPPQPRNTPSKSSRS